MVIRLPSYRKHSATGQARVTIRGKTFYLGKFGSPQSQKLYSTLIQEHLSNAGRFTPKMPDDLSHAVPSCSTVNEIALAYLKHATEYYQSNPIEVEKIKLAIRPLRKRYGRTPVTLFDCLKLEAVQEEMIESKLARTTINERVRVIKRLFKWGVRKKLVPAGVYGELLAVEGLKCGRSKARETEPVTPVAMELVDAVLGVVNRFVAAMIRLQLLTGARPGEICTMRRSDIDTSGPVWIYRPSRHKTQYRGQKREIYLGPQAQAIVTSFFRSSFESYLFSPYLVREERYAKLRAARKSKVPPSQRSRRRTNAKRLPGPRYTTYSYRQAIRDACEKANVPKWRPNQLRHNAATLLRKHYGVELARIILGHKTAFTTEIYAEVDRSQAVDVIARIG